MNFKINDYLTIKKFKLIDNEIVQFMKFGQLEDYKRFSGFIDKQKVEGFVCLKDDQIYNMVEVWTLKFIVILIRDITFLVDLL